MTDKTILIVDDEENILELLRFNLKNAGFLVDSVLSGEDALKYCQHSLPDLILLDIMLPGLDGLETCKRLKSDEHTSYIPIIMITAKSEEIDKLAGFDLGADDYITKPFNIKELIARVKALLKRTSSSVKTNNDKAILKFGDIAINTLTYDVLLGNNKVVLTLKEFELLKLLATSEGKVLTRDFLLDNIWGYEFIGETRTVDVHIRHLRQKLGDDNGCKYIETVRGIGYRFKF